MSLPSCTSIAATSLWRNSSSVNEKIANSKYPGGDLGRNLARPLFVMRERIFQMPIFFFLIWVHTYMTREAPSPHIASEVMNAAV